MRYKAAERPQKVSKPSAGAAAVAPRLPAGDRGKAIKSNLASFHLPTLFPVDPIAPSVTESLNSLRMQMQAGVPLGKTLRTCGKLCKPERARRAFEKAAEQVDQGASFDDALHTLSVVLSFPEQAILSAGWHAGRIEPAIKSVVTRRDVMLKTRREVRSKMVLPCILLVAASFVAPLPGYILGMLGVGASVSGTQYLIQALTPISIALAAFIVVRVFQHKSTRQYAGRGLDGPPPPAMPWDYPVLKIPILAMVQKWRNRGEFATLMGNLLAAGLGTLNSLQICAKALPNGVYRNSVLRCRKKVEKEGISIAEALPPGDLWPLDWLAALEVGHESGEEETVFKRLGEHAMERYLEAVRIAGDWAGKLMYVGVSVYIVFQILALVGNLASGLNSAIDSAGGY